MGVCYDGAMITWVCTACEERQEFDDNDEAMKWVGHHARQGHITIKIMTRSDDYPPGLGNYRVDTPSSGC